MLCTDPLEQRKVEELKVRREEVASRKTALLGNLTKQIKAIMAKLTDPSVSEHQRETLRSLLLGLKDALFQKASRLLESRRSSMRAGPDKRTLG